MPVDFTIVQSVRQRFGDNNADDLELPVETEAPFVGAMKEFPFSCANVDRSQQAILQFQSQGVTNRKNILRVNGTDVFGGISLSVDFATNKPVDIFIRPDWATHSLILHPGLLRDDNILRIESRSNEGTTSGNLDDFVIDNIIVLYKTRATGRVFQWLFKR